MSLNLFQRGLILVGAPLLLEIVLISCLSFLLYQSAEERLQETKYRKFSSEIARMIGLVSSAPFVMAASVQFHNEKLFHEYEKQRDESHNSLAELKELIKQIPEITEKDYKELDDSIAAVFAVTDSIAEKRQDFSNFNTIEKMESFQATLVKSKQICYLHLEAMFNAGDKMLKAAQQKLDRTQRSQMIILNVGLALNILMALFLSFFFRRSILKRINIIARNTERLAQGEPLLPEIGGRDEIGQFDRAFHTMLEQLQNAAKNEQELFDNASDVICVLDADNNFVRVNPASQKDWGLAPETLVGGNLSAFLSAEDFETANKAIKQAKQTGNASSFETTILSADKGKLLGLWSVYWSNNEQQLFCIIHDQTESKQVEQSRKRFMAMISSDLKLPLNRISIAFNKLCEELLENANKQAKDKLDMTRKNIRRLLTLVNDLLAVTELESGKFDLNCTSLSRRELLAHAAADLEALADNKDIKIEIESEDGPIFADSDRIVQVLVNLLSNAIKFSANGSKIILNCKADPSNSEIIVFKVIDQGRGIPSSHKETVFEKFSQVEVADGKRKAGTGLGLPICKQIIEKHFGKIGVESTEGEGSTFWFTLPANQIAQETQKAKHAEEEKHRQAAEASNTSIQAGRQTQLATSQRSAQATFMAPRSTGLMLLLDKLTLGQKGTVLVAIPVVMELTLVAILSSSLYKMEEERAQELHMRQMALTTSELSKYMLYSSGSVVNSAENFRWNRFANSLHAIKKLESDLAAMTEDDPVAKREFDKFEVQSDKLEKYTHSLVKTKLENSAGVASVLQEKVKQLPALVSSCRHLRNLIEHAEQFEFTSPEKEINQRNIQFAFLYGALFLNIGFSVLLAILFSVGVSKRILIMANNAARLANDDPLNPLMGGRDELAALDAAFHQTARSLSEARKKERAVFDNCQDVLCIISPSGQFIGINAAVENSWGYAKKEFLNSSLETIVDAEDLKDCKQALLTASGAKQAPFDHDYECRIKKGDGSTIHVHWSASRQAGQENTFCVVRDISKKKELEELRREFLAMVSHDLRTPLTAINGIVQLIQAGVFGAISESANVPINAIRKNVGSLLDLISDILDLEKIAAGKMELNRDFVRVSALLQAAKEQSEDADASVTIEQLDTDESINVDRDRLSGALGNLARFLFLQSNKSTQLSLKAKQKSSGNFEFEIRDTGPALAEKQRNELFLQEREAWENEKSLRDESFHADLLLPLAKKIIEAHSGSISVETNADGNNLICVSVKAEVLVAEKI